MSVVVVARVLGIPGLMDISTVSHAVPWGEGMERREGDPRPSETLSERGMV